MPTAVETLRSQKASEKGKVLAPHSVGYVSNLFYIRAAINLMNIVF